MRAVAGLVAAVGLLATDVRADTVRERFAPPTGFTRDVVVEGPFASSLQALPLRPAGTPVLTFAGTPAHAPWARAVVDVSVGARRFRATNRAPVLIASGRRRANQHGESPGSRRPPPSRLTSPSPPSMPWLRSRRRKLERSIPAASAALVMLPLASRRRVRR